MKKLILVTGALMLPVLPLTAHAAEFYLQAQAGHVSYNELNSDSFLLPGYGDTRFEYAFDNEAAFGVELGFAGFERHDVLRLGLGWQQMDADIDRVRIAYSGGSLTGAGAETLDNNELQQLEDDQGLDLGFGDNINLYSFNLYYDFPVDYRFKPYIGIGAGLLDVDNARDNESGMVLSAGGRYEVNEHFDLGIKYQHTDFDSLEHSEGFKLRDFASNIISITLDLSF